ncbi:MAG: nitrate reductase molybdenum cofactor assembly chaperone [Gemmataceae bacterium]|nr:nitrate reductase molybdenum cofactor assembly chaperone [Gemmataceae bacterium]
MSEITRLYDSLAGLFTYPGEDHRARLEECRQLLAEIPDAAALLERFQQRTANLGLAGMEELYTHTFDLNPVCSLEVGWHLFGENYSRGEFLVEMRQQLRRAGLEESGELPDHLCHVLVAVARMGQPAADRFVAARLLPALQKMLTGLAGKENPYGDLLEAVRCVATSPYGAVLEGANHD